MVFEYYGLESDPFSLRPDLDFLFLSKAHEEAVAHLVYGLEQQEDITLIIGDIGTGKTLAIHRLLQGVSSSFVSVSINVTSLNFEQLLGLILRKMNVVVPPGGGLDLLLHKFEVALVELRASGRKLLLVIDEAQNLAPADLEGVRLLMNLAQPGAQVLQLVVAGQIGLAEALALPELRQFKQRIRVEYRLTCLDRSETEAYIAHRLKTAGRESPLFKAAAIDKIFAISEGVPRLVNHLASKALLAGFVARSKDIGAGQVDEQDAPGRAQPQQAAGTLAQRRPEKAEASASDDDSGTRAYATRRPTAARKRRRRGGVVVLAAVVVLLAAAALTRSLWLPLVQGGVLARSEPQLPHKSGPGPVETPLVPQAESATVLAVADEDTTQYVATGSSQDSQVLEQATVATLPDVDQERVPAAPARESGRTEAEGPGPAPSAGYAVHVASFVDEGRADLQTSRYSAKGLPTYVGEKVTRDNAHWYRVYLGPYPSKDEAEAVAADLRQSGVVSYSLVIKLPNGSETPR